MSVIPIKMLSKNYSMQIDKKQHNRGMGSRKNYN